MVTALTSSFCRYAPATSFRGAYWQVRAASSRLLKTGFGRLARLSRRTGPAFPFQMRALTLEATSFAVARLLTHLRAGHRPSDEARAG